MVEGTGDLNSKRAELTFVICYLLCNLGELLTLRLSFFVTCRKHLPYRCWEGQVR